MARYAMEPPLSRYPCIIDMVDVDSVKWAEYRARSRGFMRWVYGREAARLARFESEAAAVAFVTLVVNDREQQALLKIVPAACVEVVPNGIDTEYFAPPAQPGGRPVVVMCGVLNYLPNVDGALWFAREVWPRVRAVHTDAQFVLVGSSPTAAIRSLGSAASGIVVTGRVPDVRPYLWDSSLAVAPLHIARGVQNKVLEAVAAGLPCVVTTQVAAGLPPTILPACVVAGDATTFADAVADLLSKSPDQRRQRAHVDALEELSWPHALQRLPALLASAAASSPRTPVPPATC